MASYRKRGRVWYYRVVDTDGVQREHRGCSDRRETEAMAAQAETEAARVRAGLSDPKAEARRRHASRPLSRHLADWLAHLTDKGNTAKHATLFTDRARRFAAIVNGGRLAEIDPPKTATKAARDRAAQTVDSLLNSARLEDLTPDAVQRALAVLRAGGRSLATCNHHRAAVRAFSRWAWRDGRTAEDALAGVTGFNAKEDRRHDRRTLGLDDLRRLIRAAQGGTPYRGMTGPARALCYRLAVATGLRYSEIMSITPASFAFGREPATVTVAAGYTKNGEPATLPLPSDLAADLARFVATVTPGRPVFPLPNRGADMLKPDLAAAGIPYRDGAGLVFDFHALRCQCATLADRAGNSPRVVQKLMRHSTLELTGRYTRPRMHDIEAATASLPTQRPPR
jgi:integrase